MTTKDFYYNLPNELIAQTPLDDRTVSKLMVLFKGGRLFSYEQYPCYPRKTLWHQGRQRR